MKVLSPICARIHYIEETGGTWDHDPDKSGLGPQAPDVSGAITRHLSPFPYMVQDIHR